MKTTQALFMTAALLPFLAGCIGHPTTLSAVGPDPSGRGSAGSGSAGRLEVFSAAEIRAAENTPSDYHGYFNPHTSYEISDEAGHTVKYVRNRASFMDETPDQVRLAPGHYTVIAQSSCCGMVSVPVEIQAGQKTVVHLDGNWQPSHPAPAGGLVYLPDGASVGWSSLPAHPAN
jgi:hypothetical protein